MAENAKKASQDRRRGKGETLTTMQVQLLALTAIKRARWVKTCSFSSLTLESYPTLHLIAFCILFLWSGETARQGFSPLPSAIELKSLRSAPAQPLPQNYTDRTAAEEICCAIAFPSLSPPSPNLRVNWLRNNSTEFSQNNFNHQILKHIRRQFYFTVLSL